MVKVAIFGTNHYESNNFNSICTNNLQIALLLSQGDKRKTPNAALP